MKKLLVAMFVSVMCGCAPENQGGGSPPAIVQPYAAQTTVQPAQERVIAPARAKIKFDGVTGDVSTARNIYVVYDNSGSMNQAFRAQAGKNRFNSKIEGANWAVHEFIKTVPDDVNLGLMVFSEYGGREIVPLGTGNRQVFLKAIDGVKTDQRTPLGEAIKAAADRLTAKYKDQFGCGEFRLVVVTDGEATGKVTVAEAVQYADSYGWPIYTIGLDVNDSHELRKFSVKYFPAGSAEDLKKGLEESAAETETFDDAQFYK